MAMKFNKEILLKHRFWIMLGTAVTLILVGIIILELSEAEGRVLLVKALKANQNPKVTDSPKTVKTYQDYAKIARENETQVWLKAYEPQAPLFTWADPVEKEYDFANGKFATEIKVTKLPDPAPKKGQDAAKSWPADNPFLMHGTYVQQGEDWFEITDRNGKVKKFFLTKRSEKIVAEDGKLVGFAKLRDIASKKLLAVGYQRGKYFGDPLTANESRLFKESYLQQISTLLESVEPLDSKLNGVVQLRGWLYQKDALPHQSIKDYKEYPFVRYVAVEWPPIGKEISKEAWIAQEDLWIQTEIYRMIRSANDSVSNFTAMFKGKSDERDKAHAFQNSYFDLELTLDKNDILSFKIKNRLPRKQSMDLKFKVLLNSAKGHKEEVIEISGLPLMPAGTKGSGANDSDFLIRRFPKGKEQRTGIYTVQQVLSWQTAAVKRIDQVSIGSNDFADISHSQRTYAVAAPMRPLDEKDIVTGGGAPPPPPIFRKPPKAKKFNKNLIKDDKFVMPQGVGNNGRDAFSLGLWTYRYCEVTEQARRVPVGVVLIVDQGHVDRVLTSFNNSKLRFLETQVLLNQYSGSLQPPAIEVSGEGAPPPPRPIFFKPKDQPPPPKAAEPGGGGELETNMEMVIYGIVTLYQRYPPRPVLAPLEK